MKKKIVITGSNGFLGSFLCNEISNIKNLTVTGILRKKKSQNIKKNNLDYLIIKNLNDKKLSFLDNVDYIIHCAGRAHIVEKNDKRKQDYANYQITKNLYEIACKKKIKRFIFISTIGVLGDNTENRKSFNQSDKPNPKSNYSRSKLKAELFIKKFSKNSETEFVIIRSPTIYGQHARGSFNKLIRLIDSGIPLPFRGFKNKKSFVSIENLSNLVIESIKSKNLINKTVLISDIDISLEDLIIKISKNLKSNTILFYFPKTILRSIVNIIGFRLDYQKISSTLLIDNSEIKKLLDWEIKDNFDRSLKKMIKAYQQIK